jgi:hypothetical protein
VPGVRRDIRPRLRFGDRVGDRFGLRGNGLGFLVLPGLSQCPRHADQSVRPRTRVGDRVHRPSGAIAARAYSAGRSVAVRRLANPVTLCDGHEVFFLTASGQIRMTANNLVTPRRESCDQALHRLQGGHGSSLRSGTMLPNLHIRPSYDQLSIISKELPMSVIWTGGR